MDTRIEVDVTYRGNPRAIPFTLVHKADRYCPMCGAKGVWVEEGEGDYDVGPANYCTFCKQEFSMQDSSGMGDNPIAAAILEPGTVFSDEGKSAVATRT